LRAEWVRDIETSCTEFVQDGQNMPEQDRRELLKKMASSFKQCLQHGESKVNLAMQTYDMVGRLGWTPGDVQVDKHIRRLDEDLLKFEDELMMTGCV
jgi:hypothetical protein